jgi:cytochrome c oxidase subunit III
VNNRRHMQNNLAMTVILISGTMLFATLLMGYSIYRSSSPMWPPMGSSKAPLGYPILSTITLVLSSWFSHKVQEGVKNNDIRRARLNLDTTLSLGALFMGIQTMFWIQLKDAGVLANSGIFSSIMYGFTWIHAFHVILGLSSLIWLRFVLKTTTDNLWQKALNVEKFWHFLGIIWLIMFFTLFVL